MKNSLFYDMMHQARIDIRKNHKFATKYGGLLTNEQKEQFKKDICVFIDSFPEWNGDGYKFPEKEE